MVALVAQILKDDPVEEISAADGDRCRDLVFDMGETPLHQPVMLREVVEHLAVRSGSVMIDATAGEGGHSLALLQASAPSGCVLGVDRDPRSLSRAEMRLSQFGNRFITAQGSFADLAQLAEEAGIDQVDGVLMDLGLSSWQLEASGAGFSFQRDEPLDMRFDPTGPRPTAAELLNSLSHEELRELLFKFGEEPRSNAIARAIVRAREVEPFQTTGQLIGILQEIPGLGRGRKTHPATRIFQALRIAVNDELANVEQGILSAIQLLKPSGRLVVISYHSLEDRLVKQTFSEEASGCLCPRELPVCVCNHEPAIKLISRKIIRPAPEEVAANPRSRSARMRVAEKV